MGLKGLFSWVRPDARAVIAARFAVGERAEVLAAEFGCSAATVWRIGRETALAGPRPGSGLRLSFAERELISRGIAAGRTDSEIARELGRHRSTICREVRACGGRERYRALAAERKARVRARRPKATKLATCPQLLGAVERGLELWWSPEQISARLKVDHPDDLLMRISHETIYRSLYVQSRGELRRELARNLRSGRTRRRSQGRTEQRGQIVDMVPIAQRPPEADDRRVPGHWEGDLIIGAAGKSAVATLVERQTRFVMLARLEDDRTTKTVVQALEQQIGRLPAHLARSLTWDQGSEMSAHKAFTAATGIAVYFCDPRSPWQRGSNENTNGLLRQYLPRKTDLAEFGQIALDNIATQLNDRPRKTLEWATPAEKMDALLR